MTTSTSFPRKRRSDVSESCTGDAILGNHLAPMHSLIGGCCVISAYARPDVSDDFFVEVLPSGEGRLLELPAGGVETTQGLLEIFARVHCGNKTTHAGQDVLPLFHQ
jgi:hypothetical protein